MADKPNWTDKMSAGSALLSMIFALVSSLALIVIAQNANELQEEIKNLTFPEPEPVFTVPSQLQLSDGLSSGVFYENEGTVDLSASGFSTQDIIIDSISISEVTFPDAEQFMTPAGSNGIDIQWGDQDGFVIETDDQGRISAAIPLPLLARFATNDYSSTISEALPLEIVVTFQIDWIEAQTMRPHSTTLNSTVRVN